jgi:ribosomal protein L32
MAVPKKKTSKIKKAKRRYHWVIAAHKAAQKSRTQCRQRKTYTDPNSFIHFS